VRPVFLGAIIGFAGGGAQGGTFLFSSLYTGVIINDYRVEIGKTYADSSPFSDKTPSDYRVYFLDLSKRFGTVIFLEPDIKAMFPTVGHHWQSNPGYSLIPTTEFYHFGNLYFAISVKVGIGFN